MVSPIILRLPVFRQVEASMLLAVALRDAVFMPTTNKLGSLRPVGRLDTALGAVMIAGLVERTEQFAWFKG
jgi:hypothetical protein